MLTVVNQLEADPDRRTVSLDCVLVEPLPELDETLGELRRGRIKPPPPP